MDVSLHIFCPMLVEQLLNLRKVKNQNFKFKTDPHDQVVEGW